MRGLEQIPWLYDALFAAMEWTGLPNRDTERAVAAAGFRIDPDTRRASGLLRRFEARK